MAQIGGSEDNLKDLVPPFRLAFEAGSLLFPPCCVLQASWPVSFEAVLILLWECWVTDVHHHIWLFYLGSGDAPQAVLFVKQLLLPAEPSPWACFGGFESASHTGTGTHYVA